jgi:ankyrin repeat protein
MWGDERRLLVAAGAGGQPTVEKLLRRGVNVNCEDKARKTPLAEAAAAGHLAVVELLLKHGAGVEGSGCGKTPLAAAADAGHLAIVELLLEHGADVEGSKYGRGDRPLKYASARGHIEVIAALARAGAKLDDRGLLGRTPLSYAAHVGNVKVVKALLALGADPLEDGGHWSPLAQLVGPSAAPRRPGSDHDEMVRVLRAAVSDAEQRCAAQRATQGPAVAAPCCASCSRQVVGWHYEFESVELARRLGEQCPDCGVVLCREHSSDRCESCGGETVALLQGAASSSMVDAAKRRGKYGRFIVAPSESSRIVVQG